MDERDARHVGEKLWRALQVGDWETARGCLHDDFVQEWPQSGERIIGRDNAIAIEQNFPGGLPTMRFRRTLAGGDLAVLEVELTYADGSRYLGASILELRDGKVMRETDYYSQPFPLGRDALEQRSAADNRVPGVAQPPAQPTRGRLVLMPGAAAAPSPA